MRSAADTDGAHPGADATAPAPVAPAHEPDEDQARELIRRAVARLGGAAAVRLDADRYLAAVSDINGTGRLNIAVVALDEPFADLTEPGVMTDSSRLYRADARTPLIFLVLFELVGDEIAAGASGLQEIHRFSIGYRRVVTDLAVRPLHTARPAPAAFVVTIVTREGREEYWCALTRDGHPTTVIAESVSGVRTAITDIEGNGYQDFLRYQQVFESGRGHDTLISWIRWTDDGFEDSGVTNIVRNLTQFLDWAGRTLVRAAWAEFADYGLIPADRRDLIQAELSAPQMVDAVFAAENHQTFTEIARREQIAEVVFPEIGRNPFPELGRQTSFRVSLRVVTDAHESYFFQTEIAMQLNPFQPQQFFFRPAEIRPASVQGE